MSRTDISLHVKIKSSLWIIMGSLIIAFSVKVLVQFSRQQGYPRFRLMLFLVITVAVQCILAALYGLQIF